MASEEKIDSYVDRSAITDDTKFLTDQLKTVLDLFDKVNSSKISLNGSNSMKDVATNADAVNKSIADLQAQNSKLQKSYDDLAKKLAENKKTTDDLQKAKDKLSSTQTAEAKEIALVNQQRIEANKQLKIQAELENASAGSIDLARAKVKELTKERNSLNLTTEEGKQRQAELNKEINQYNDFIKKNVDELAKQKINIGNYEGSAKIIVDALERARQKFDALNKSADASPAALADARREFETLRGITDDKQFLSYAAKVGDAQKEVRAFTRVLIDLESRDEGNSKAAVDLRKHLAELTDQIADTKAEVKALSSDTRSFDLFAGAVNFAADTFQTFAGALSLGTQSEQEAQESLKTLVAIQTTANGVKGIANELTTHGTAANKLFSFAQNQVAIAMDETASAATRLKAALVTLGIGAVIIGIGLLVANFGKLKDALSGLSDTQKAMNKVNQEAIDGYVQEQVHVEALVREVNNENTTKKRKKEIVKELNDLSPTYFSNLKSEKDLQDKLNDSVVKYIRAIELKARAKAAENALVEAEKPILERQIELEKELDAVQDKTFDTEERKQRTIKGYKDLIAANNEAIGTGIITPKVDKEIAYLIKQKEPIKKIFDDINTQIQNLGGDPNKPIDLPFAKTKKIYTAELEEQAAAFKQLSENEDAYLSIRLQSRENALSIQKNILKQQMDAELFNLNEQIKVEAAKGIIDDNKQKEFNQAKLNILNDFKEKEGALERAKEKDLTVIRQSYLAKLQEQKQQEVDLTIKGLEEQRNAEIEAIQQEQLRRLSENVKGQQAEIKALDDWYVKRIERTKEGSRARNKVEEKYAQDRAEIEYRYSVAALKNQIDAAEKIIKIHKAAGLNVADEEKNLSDLRIQLSDAETKHITDNEKKKYKTFQERMQKTEEDLGKIQEIEGKVSDVIGGFISANTERQKNANQEQIDAIDQKKEKEIDAVNASTASEKEKADKIALINARADAQKQALDIKQRQLDLQKARYDKAANIARITIETALAVVHQLGTGDPYTAIPRAIAAGVLGAAQLAVAIATPLPKYKSGRKGGPAQWAITGDGGVPEVAASPDLSQAFVTPATDTITWLPKNWHVFPDVATFQETAMNMLHKPLPTLPVIQNENEGLIRAMAYEIGSLKRAILGKQETHFHWDNGELKKAIKNGNDWFRYIQNNI